VTSQDERDRAPQLRDLLAILGGASVLVVFVGALLSWSFARGLISSIGFPAQVVTLRSSIDCFPSLAFNYTGAFFVSLAYGFAWVPKRKPGSLWSLWIWILITIALLMLDIVGDLWQVRSPFYGDILVFVALFVPALVGRAFYSISGRSRIAVLLVLCYSVLAVCTQDAYQFGTRTGVALSYSAQSLYPGTKNGIAAIKMRDFPLITICTKIRLPLLSQGDSIEAGYTYPSKSSGFLRLVLQDQDAYYIVENSHGKITPFSIPKDDVIQIAFAAATSGLKPH
jgi:hypothetical protein